MANPNTALCADVSTLSVNIFLSQIMEPRVLPLFTAGFVANGVNGAVFIIEAHIGILNPFKTFYISSEKKLVYTSNSAYLSVPYPKHRFCCKIVPIRNEEQAPSFRKEYKKQQDIYARTNNLNAVCLPLFFGDVVLMTDVIPLTQFIRSIRDNVSVMSKIILPDTPYYGISFMPYSVNNLQLYDPARLPPSLQQFTASRSILQNYTQIIETINRWVDRSSNPPRQQFPDETNIIQIFQTNIPIYSYVLVVSLLIRLYFVGYFHGDTHPDNFVVYPTPSGMIKQRNQAGQLVDIYFYPSLTLIDLGYAFKGRHDTTHGLIRSYEEFVAVIHNIIFTIVPISGMNMITHADYNWFPRIFMDDKVTINDNRCRFIFHLFQAFETYRISFESQQFEITNKIDPTICPVILNENTRVIATVNAYITSLSPDSPEEQLRIYNTLGGRRRRRRRINYYVSNKKQRKITKKHTVSMRHRKSKKQRQLK